MTPAADRMSSNKSLKRLTKRAIGDLAGAISPELSATFSVERLKTISTVEPWKAALLWSGPNPRLLSWSWQVLHESFEHHHNSRPVNRRAVQCDTKSYRSANQVNSIHALCQNISSVTMPTCDVLLHHLEKCCYTHRDTLLHTLISYLLLVHSILNSLHCRPTHNIVQEITTVTQ